MVQLSVLATLAQLCPVGLKFFATNWKDPTALNSHNQESTKKEQSFQIVLIGSSAGGVAALTSLISKIPPEFSAAILIVQHLAKDGRSLLSSILSRVSHLPVKEAAEGDKITGGQVFVAPSNQHLLVKPDHTLTLSQAPCVEFVRPSINLLFESAAAIYKEQAISVILTGTGHDGTKGIQAISAHGGVVIVQTEASAQFTGMPHAAITTGLANWILPLEEIPNTIVNLVSKDKN
jgi:two-component system chemotaxis response regulator CheB